MSEEYKVIEGRIYKRFREDITKPRLKGKLSFEESLQMLINKCMTCEAEDFPENVHRLFWSLPASWRDDELMDEYDDCQQEVELVMPVTCCGVPVVPEAIPERRQDVTETDWHGVFNAILNCCNRHNLLIPMERVEVVVEEE